MQLLDQGQEQILGPCKISAAEAKVFSVETSANLGKLNSTLQLFL